MTSRPPLTPDEVRLWGKHAHGSPLYTHLVGVIADDPELMRVINEIEHTPRQNMLLAGVQYLMMRDGASALAPHFESMSGPGAPAEGVDRPFRDFVLAHEAELIEIGRTRYTQTNECRRCAALLPVVWESDVDTFHLVDVGTSAGLNLMLDRYRYRWDGLEWGSPDSTVVLDAELRGRAPEPADIDVLSRTGLDLNPLDPADPDDRLWLDALVWPEHHERRERLRAALDLAATAEFDLVAGSALDTLGETLDRLPSGEPAVVIHSFTVIQFTRDELKAFEAILEQGRSQRPVVRLHFEYQGSLDDDWPQLILDDGSGPATVAQAHPHGEWLDLYARP